MWNNAQALAQVASVAIWIAAVAGVVAAAAGLIGAVFAGRSSELVNQLADQKIASANARAEEAKLETARVWSEVSWRRLSEEQAGRLIASLEGERLDFTLAFNREDPEASVYRADFERAFQLAGLQPGSYNADRITVGLVVSGPHSQERDRLSKVLTAAGLPHVVKEFPVTRLNAKSLMLTVGSKPPPNFEVH